MPPPHSFAILGTSLFTRIAAETVSLPPSLATLGVLLSLRVAAAGAASFASPCPATTIGGGGGGGSGGKSSARLFLPVKSDVESGTLFDIRSVRFA